MDHDAGGDDEIRQIHAPGRHDKARASVMEGHVLSGDRRAEWQLMPFVRNVYEPKSTGTEDHATHREPEISRVVHQAADLAGRDAEGCPCVSGAIVGSRGNAFF